MTDKQEEVTKDTTADIKAREQKNAVFTAQQMADAGHGVPIMTRQDMAKQEFQIEIPVSEVPLPSRGKTYPSGHPLHMAESVAFRAMTSREEDLLMSPALIKKGTVITELIHSCLVDKTIDVANLLSGDRNALMIGIRSHGYGQIYDPTQICPNCEFKNELQIDLAELPIKSLELEPIVPGTNEFEYTLPAAKKRVIFRFLTGRDEEEIVARTEMRKKKGIPSNDLITTRLFYMILEIDGNRDRSYIQKFTSVMLAKDSKAFRKFVNKHEPGVGMSIDFCCSSCDYVESMVMPMTAAFFWDQS